MIDQDALDEAVRLHWRRWWPLPTSLPSDFMARIHVSYRRIVSEKAARCCWGDDFRPWWR